MNKLFLFLAFLSFCSCNHSDDLKYVVSNMWEYDSGNKGEHGDFIMFDKEGFIHMSGDTILGGKTPMFLFIKLDKKNNEMHVRDLRNNGECIYINTLEFTK